MNCPFCSHPNNQVIDTRQSTYNQIPGIRRRRQCEQCSKRFSSFEMTINDLEGVEPATLDGLLTQITKLFKEAPRTNYKAPSSLEKSVYHPQNGHKSPAVKPKTPTETNSNPTVTPTKKLTDKDIKEALQRARQRYADELDASEFSDEDFD